MARRGRPPGKPEKPVPVKLYLRFAGLADASDAVIAAFTEEHGRLGLGSGVGEWNIRDIVTTPDGTGYLVPWEGKIIPVDGHRPFEETPERVRLEAHRMGTVIQLHRLLWECYDQKQGRPIMLDPRPLPDQPRPDSSARIFIIDPGALQARKGEIERLASDMHKLWPGMGPGIDLVDANGEVVWVPYLPAIYRSILSRVQLTVSEAPFASSGVLRPVGCLPQGMRIGSSCLLAHLWYKCLADLVEGTAPPMLCRHCHVLFTPSREKQVYCSMGCQKAAVQYRRRTRGAETYGRELGKPGRPPRSKKPGG